MCVEPQPCAVTISNRTPRAIWCGVFACAAALYISTACRDVQWQDAGWQQFRIVSGQIEHPRGLALYHPVQYYLGRAALAALPWLEPAHAITLVSSLAAAAAIGNIALLVWVLTRRTPAALFSAVGLGLSHTFWQQATHTESYAITAALLSAEWLLLARWIGGGSAVNVVAALALNGLGIGNHMLAALATPVDAAIVVMAVRSKRIPLRVAAIAGLAWLVGTLPYSAWIAHTWWATGDALGTIRSALFAKYAVNVLNVHVSARQLALSAGYFAYNFAGLLIPLALWGMTRRRALPALVWWILIVEAAVFFVFVARYSITDQYTYFVPVYALLAVFAGVGAAEVVKSAAPARRALMFVVFITALWSPLIYAGAASVLRSNGAFGSLVGNKPYRDGYRAFFIPWGVGDSYGGTLNAELARIADDDGVVIITDHMQGFAIHYGQVTGTIPPAVTLLDAYGTLSDEVRLAVERTASAARANGVPVVQVPRDRDVPVDIIPGATWRRAGDLYVWDEAAP